MRETWTDQQGQEWRSLSVEEVREYLALERGIWEGYCEARSNRPFEPFRFAGEQIAQVRYEDGRKMFALVQARKGIAPEWINRWLPPQLLINVCIDEMRKGRSIL